MGRLRETLDIRDERTDEDARAPFPPGRRHRASHMSELRINDASQSSLESAESARPAGEREQAGIALRVTSAETDAPAPVRPGACRDSGGRPAPARSR